MKAILPILYNLGIYSAYLAGFLYLRNQSVELPASKSKPFRFPWVTLFLFLMVAILSILQNLFPDLLLLFRRDTVRFLDGEWWRLVTPLFFQDGGIGGTISNLVGLALIGVVAEQLWDRRDMLLIFFAGGLAGELIGLVWQPVGAGNSVANFSLAASAAIACLMRRPPQPVLVTALFALGT
ncbi:MAG: rhomboid family intramembrane serine protease, partial [Chloroflexota bacterium]|nr:rhomboid family intramembrane serine protease [Anaerolineales bacterium]